MRMLYIVYFYTFLANAISERYKFIEV